VEKILLKIKLFANRKNDYHLHLPFTNHYGEISVTSDWLSERIYSESSIAIMDYSSDLYHCKDFFEIIFVEQEKFEGMIKAMKMWQPATKITNEELDSYNYLNNHLYKPWSQIYNATDENMNIEIFLEPI
jgi:hypothetical protein